MKPKFVGTEKKCIDCHETFPLSEFYRAKKTGAYSSRCKKCDILSCQQRSSASYKSRSRVLCNAARSASKKKNLPFTITPQDIVRQYESQNGKCYYSGQPMSFISNDKNIMSIDRINPSCGYTPDNIVLCRWSVNNMKSNLSVEDFLSTCKAVYHFSENRTF